MNLSEPFIRRPVMTTLVMIGILVFGLVAYRGLPVSDLPPVDYPTISVTASVPGASPTTMAASVATPLEKQFSTIAGLEAITSTSFQGSTQITLQFALDRDIDAAASDVQAAIAQAVRQLPQNIDPPNYQKVDPSQSAIIVYALTSNSLRLSQLDEYGADHDRPAPLHGGGRGPGPGVRLAEVRRAGAARSAGTGGAADRHR